MKLENNYIIYTLFLLNRDQIELRVTDSLTPESINAIATEKFDSLTIEDGDWSNLDILLEYKKKIIDLSIQTENLNWRDLKILKDCILMDVLSVDWCSRN